MIEVAIEEIRAKLPQMTPQHQKIGLYFCEHPEDLGKVQLTELAQKIGTSEPSIIRFCRTLGYAGFREFSKKINSLRCSELSYASYFHKTRVKKAQLKDKVNLMQVLLKKISSNARTLAETFPIEKITHCIEMMQQSSSIFIVGRMNAYPAAVYFEQLLSRTTPKIFPMNCYDGMQATALSQMNKQSLVFCIAFPQTPKSVLDIAKNSKDKDAYIITITNNELSILAQMSDLILPIEVEMFSYIDMYVPIFVLIDIICLAFSLSQEEQSEYNLKLYDMAERKFYVQEPLLVKK